MPRYYCVPPPLFALLTSHWGLREALTRRWWFALVRSQWAIPLAWRRRVELYERDRHWAAVHLEQVIGTPAEIIAVLEALTQEGQLRRRQTTHIEEAILNHSTRTGAWR
jgi:hypothetical protein